MKLVIAEKPSVAQSLAAVIGATARKDGYLEGGGWRVSWCVGHLAGLADADAYNPDYAKWRYDDLPILPEPWQMVVSKDKKKQFDVLKCWTVNLRRHKQRIIFLIFYSFDCAVLPANAFFYQKHGTLLSTGRLL